MKKIPAGFILPSACFTVSHRQIRFYQKIDKKPSVGDVVYGKVTYIGEHSALENKEGRIHLVNDGTRAVFVYGNRYAPDAFEGFVPEGPLDEVDILARSGVIGVLKEKNVAVKDPSKVQILGNVLDPDGEPLNTMQFPLITLKEPWVPDRKRSKMILHIGTSMNAGKSTSAIACCQTLSAMGHSVRGAKVTGTASLKDILHMQDCGAERIADFSHLGYPSTYMLDENELMGIFNAIDARYANNPMRYWVVEFADGICQRETAMLLHNETVRNRIYRLIFSAADAFSAIGGLRVLEENFGLIPHAISGRCTSSPLGIRELRGFTDIPVINNRDINMRAIGEIIL